MRIKLDHWSKFWLGFAAGILAISVVTEVVTSFTTNDTRTIFFRVTSYVGRFEWLERYQTLLTGVAAVVAAGLSIREVRRQVQKSDEAVQRQIEHAASTEQRRRADKRAAAIATLPLTLSAISGYAGECGRMVHSLLRQCEDGRLPLGAYIPPFPAIPADVAGSLKEMVEYTEAEERSAFTGMIQELQILNSRLSSLYEKEEGNIVGTSIHTLHSYLATCVSIYARTEALYPYARSEEGLPDDLVPEDSIETALHTIGVWDFETVEALALWLVRQPPELVEDEFR